ncbi:MAG: ubiquitin-related domain-containing protein, partial [Linnemannia elongata]
MPTTLDIINANSGPGEVITVPYIHKEPISAILKRIQTTFSCNGSLSNTHENLYLNGKRLKDQTKPLAHYRIFGRTLTYHVLSARPNGPRPFSIQVITPTGKIIPLICHPHTLVEDVKDMVQEKERIADDQQIITYAGIHLEDARMLQFYGISAGSSLHVVLRRPYRNTFSVKVTTPVGTVISLTCVANMLVQDVKDMIQAQEGIFVDNQTLFHGVRQIEDFRDLKFYGITEPSSLRLLMPLPANHPGIVFTDGPDGSFGSRKIQLSPNAPRGRVASPGLNSVYHQDLLLHGTPLEDHNRTLEDYCIVDHHTTLTYHALSFRSRTEGDVVVLVNVLYGESYTLHFAPETTIHEVKTVMHLLSGLETSAQILIFAGKKLEDECSLADYGMGEGSIVHLVRRRPGG